jgi:outer membrane protein assembly factor BamB/subtilisin family serine protease
VLNGIIIYQAQIRVFRRIRLRDLLYTEEKGRMVRKKEWRVVCVTFLLSVVILLTPASEISPRIGSVSGVEPLSSGETLVQVNPDSSLTYLEESRRIDVSVSNVTKLYGFDFKVHFNSTVLEAVDVVEGGFLNEPTLWVAKYIDNVAGVVEVAAVSLYPAAPANGSGVLAGITFNGKVVGASCLNLTDTLLLDPDAQEIAHNATSGETGVIPRYVERELCVVFQDWASEAQINETISRLGTEVKLSSWKLGLSTEKYYWLEIACNRTVLETADLFSNESIVMFAEPNYLEPVRENLHQEYPNDPLFKAQWGLLNTGQTDGVIDADIDAPQAWPIFEKCNLWRQENVVVAVIDTGADLDNPDLHDNLWTNQIEAAGVNGVDDDLNGYVDDIHGFDFSHSFDHAIIPYPFVDTTDNGPFDVGRDADGHGTAVAGVIGAVGDNGLNVAGVNWHAQMMILRAIDPVLNASLIRLPSGHLISTFANYNSVHFSLLYVLMMKSRGHNIRVVNFSAGGEFYDPIEEQLISSLGEAGVDILFVTAVGNDAKDIDVGEYIYRKSSAPGVHNLGLVEDQDTRLTQVTAFHPGVAHPPKKDATKTYGAGSVVGANDWDRITLTPLVGFTRGVEMYVDANLNGIYNPGEHIYRKIGHLTPNRVEPHDIRLTYPISGQHEGSRVVPRDDDVGTILSDFASWDRHTDNQHVGPWAPINWGIPDIGLRIYEGPADYPPKYPLNNIIAVAASNDLDHLADFSSYGRDSADLAAPGESVTLLRNTLIGNEGAFIYVDMDFSGRVSASDIRISRVAIGRKAYPAFSRVRQSDLDLGASLTACALVPPQRVRATLDLPFAGSVYLDDNGDSLVSTGDVRLTQVAIYPAGSVVAQVDLDRGCHLNPPDIPIARAGIVSESGTSFAAPHVAGVCSLAFAMFPQRSGLEVKNDILNGNWGNLYPCVPGIPDPPASAVDRKPPFGAEWKNAQGGTEHHKILVSDGRLRWPYTGDLGDAPNNGVTEFYASIAALEGGLHWDTGNEWFGLPLGRGYGQCSNEVGALWPPPFDEDDWENLKCRTFPDQDVWDHPNPPNFWFNPGPPWFPGQLVTVFYFISTNYLGVNDAEGGRYQSMPSRMIYVNGFFDWNWNNRWDPEHTVHQAHDLSVIMPPGRRPNVSPPEASWLWLSSTFIAQGTVPRWFRFRLDYGEDAGLVDPNPSIPDPVQANPCLGLPGFLRDPQMPASAVWGRARYGEVEDFPLCLKNPDWPWYAWGCDASGARYTISAGPETNNTIWMYNGISPMFSSPAVEYGKVYIGSRDGNVRALDVTTGNVLWNCTTGGEVDSSPAVANGRVFVGSWDDNLYALNATNGQFLWRKPTGGNVYSSPVVANGKVFVGSDGGNFYAFREDGVQAWNYSVGEQIKSSPAVVDGRVYFGSWFGKIIALNAETGALAWMYPTGKYIFGSPSVVSGSLYIPAKVGGYTTVYCLNATTGTLRWNYTVDHDTYASLAVAYGKVILCTYTGEVLALNAETGTPIWSTSFPGSLIYSSPLIACKRKVFVCLMSGFVYCLEPESGATLWKYKTGGSVYSSPAVVNSTLFVATTTGKLYAFRSLHDVSPIGASFTKTVVGQGQSTTIRLTIKNNGDFSEDVGVIASENYTVLQMNSTVISSGSSGELDVTINTENWTKGWHVIDLVVPPVFQEYECMHDNMLLGLSFFVTIPGDVNGNRKVDLIDVYSVGRGFGSTRIDDLYWHLPYRTCCPHSFNCDINGDGKIDLKDYYTTCKNYGKSW